MPKPHKPLIPLRYNKLVFTALSIVGIVAILYFMTPLGLIVRSALTPNYAEEVAKPIEKALVEAGAVKKCTRGNNGRSASNDEPWHEAYFEFNGDNKRAKEVIENATSTNGYKLSSTTPGTKGYLGDVVYVSNKTREKLFSDLEGGY